VPALVELFHEGMLPPRAEALFEPWLQRKNLVWSMPLVFSGDGIYDMYMLKYYGFSTGEVSFACVLIWYSTSEGVWCNICTLV